MITLLIGLHLKTYEMVVLKIENITYYTATYVKGFTEAKICFWQTTQKDLSELSHILHAN